MRINALVCIFISFFSCLISLHRKCTDFIRVFCFCFIKPAKIDIFRLIDLCSTIFGYVCDWWASVHLTSPIYRFYLYFLFFYYSLRVPHNVCVDFAVMQFNVFTAHSNVIFWCILSLHFCLLVCDRKINKTVTHWPFCQLNTSTARRR